MSISVIKTAVIVPAMVSGFWTGFWPASLESAPRLPAELAAVANPQSATPPDRVLAASPTVRAPAAESEEAAPGTGADQVTAEISARRIRVELILATLDQIAEAAVEMAPEHQARLEPVLVELAEQTIDLSEPKALRAPGVDDELDRIEATVDRLVGSISRMVEPEMSL